LPKELRKLYGFVFLEILSANLDENSDQKVIDPERRVRYFTVLLREAWYLKAGGTTSENCSNIAVRYVIIASRSFF
jgi:hypothetical protein